MDKWCRYLNDITSEDLQWGREWKIICKFSLLEWLICHQLIMVRCVSCCSSLKVVLFGKRHKLWWCEVGIVVGSNSFCNFVSNEIRCTSVSEFVNLPDVGEIILHSDRVVFVNDGVDRCLPCFGLLSASGFMSVYLYGRRATCFILSFVYLNCMLSIHSGPKHTFPNSPGKSLQAEWNPPLSQGKTHFSWICCRKWLFSHCYGLPWLIPLSWAHHMWLPVYKINTPYLELLQLWGNSMPISLHVSGTPKCSVSHESLR